VEAGSHRCGLRQATQTCAIAAEPALAQGGAADRGREESSRGVIIKDPRLSLNSASPLSLAIGELVASRDAGPQPFSSPNGMTATAHPSDQSVASVPATGGRRWPVIAIAARAFTVTVWISTRPASAGLEMGGRYRSPAVINRASPRLGGWRCAAPHHALQHGGEQAHSPPPTWSSCRDTAHEKTRGIALGSHPTCAWIRSLKPARWLPSPGTHDRGRSSTPARAHGRKPSKATWAPTRSTAAPDRRWRVPKNFAVLSIRNSCRKEGDRGSQETRSVLIGGDEN